MNKPHKRTYPTRKYSRGVSRSQRVLYSIKSAAVYIGHDVRFMRRLIENGIIFPIEVGETMFFDRDDLDAYTLSKTLRGTGTFKINESTFTALVAKTEKLKKKLSIIEKVLNMYYEPLALDDGQLKELYLSIKNIYKGKMPDIQMWGDILCRVDITHFERIISLFPEEKLFWRNILDWAYVLSIAAKTRKPETSILVNRAYENIKSTCMIYLTMKKDFKELTGNYVKAAERAGKLFELWKYSHINKKEMEELNQNTNEDVGRDLGDVKNTRKFRRTVTPLYQGENLQDLEE